MAELVRRAIDSVYRSASRPKIAGLSISGGIWRDADAALVGRRLLVRKPRLSEDVY
jgi:hypothetical protein